MKKVYIASPYTTGGTIYNIRLAIEAADTLLRAGFAPFVPHLNYSWDMVYPHSYDTWLGWCLEWVAASDCLLRVHGLSPGADAEVRLAKVLEIPVYYTVCELVRDEG